MSYLNDVQQIAEGVVKNHPDDSEGRRCDEIDEEVSRYLIDAIDVMIVLAESNSADEVEPYETPFGRKHGLAYAAMRQDLVDAVEELMRR